MTADDNVFVFAICKDLKTANKMKQKGTYYVPFHMGSHWNTVVFEFRPFVLTWQFDNAPCFYNLYTHLPPQKKKKNKLQNSNSAISCAKNQRLVSSLFIYFCYCCFGNVKQSKANATNIIFSHIKNFCKEDENILTIRYSQGSKNEPQREIPNSQKKKKKKGEERTKNERKTLEESPAGICGSKNDERLCLIH
ncbi:hypothetical protein RFI_16269 [Reticulomyxa filosa]|uniref:Uncharacterized protein n=1 Tax=Reticulomyxa filosa TaxID=46433 RepID=X6N5C9_RETFI|nr:hypothetical protein RFI_16269 [Reticulomyxa filosa]|eukprot:ETO20939.1 hypothetical protein RFI_16269 [Reticulomyxa filosa]